MTLRLSLTVSPGAGRSEIVGRHGEGWKVRVAAAPERGRANRELVALLADALGVHHGSVRVVSGAGSRRKVVEVEGLDEDEVARRLAAAAS